MTIPAAPVSPHDLGPPPRPLRRRMGWPVIIFTRYIATPAIALVILWLIVALGVSLYGTRVDGTITNIRAKKVGNSRDHFAQYTFQVDDREIHDEQRMSGERAFAWKAGETVNVRTARILGYRYSTLAGDFGDFVELNVWPICMAILLLV